MVILTLSAAVSVLLELFLLGPIKEACTTCLRRLFLYMVHGMVRCPLNDRLGGAPHAVCVLNLYLDAC